MHISRGIRMMMVRLITRATRHHEPRATCFPRGGVPTMPWEVALLLLCLSISCYMKQTENISLSLANSSFDAVPFLQSSKPIIYG